MLSKFNIWFNKPKKKTKKSRTQIHANSIEDAAQIVVEALWANNGDNPKESETTVWVGFADHPDARVYACTVYYDVVVEATLV